MRGHLGVQSLKFITIDGLLPRGGHRGGGATRRRRLLRRLFLGRLPGEATDQMARGFKLAERPS